MSNYQLVDDCDEEPLVSVAMLSYNHGKFIEKSIKSVLSQKTTFPFKLIIAEDCSSDNTREIVLKFQKENPSKIKLILQNENVGANQNNIALLNSLEGKYVAALEGDDYWIDPFKLQKQVDILEHDNTLSMTCHASQEVNEEGEQFKVSKIDQEIVTLSEVLQKGWFLRTATMLFRREAISKGFPDFFYDAYSMDYIIQVMVLKIGNCFFSQDVMAAYRHHTGGMSKGSIALQVRRWMIKVELLDKLNQYTSFDFNSEIKQHQNRIKTQISFYLIRYPNLFGEFGWSFYLRHLNVFLAFKDGINRIKKRV